MPYRTSAKPTLTRSVVLQRPSTLDRGAPASITLASGGATFVFAHQGSTLALASGAFCALAVFASVLSFRGRAVTLLADRPARELRCTDALHHLWPVTQSLALDEIVAIEVAVISTQHDTGPPFAAQVRSIDAPPAVLARFGTRHEAEAAVAKALELLVWLRNEPA